MEKLATRDNVAGVVGAYTSAVTSVAAKTAERYKVPLVNPVASKEEITRQGYKYVFRVSATTNDYAQVLLDMATTFGQPKTMAILNENTDFGVSGGRSAKEYGEKKGLKVVFNEAYSKGSPDYRSTLVNVKNSNPDVVFMVSYVADAILLMRQWREILDSGSWETIDGTVKFADYDGYTNQNKHQMLVEQIQDGKFVTVWPKELQSGKPLWPFPGWK